MAQEEPPTGDVAREPTPVERDRRRMQVDGVVFGARMKERRKKLGWSVHDLHDVTGVAASTISDLETGKTPKPAPWVTHALAVAMGCPSAGDLLAWMAARERGEPYEPASGRGLPFGPSRLPGAKAAQAVGDVRLDVLVEQLLRGVWRAQAAGEGRGSATQVTTLGVGLVLLSPRAPRLGRQRRRRGSAGWRAGAAVKRRRAT